MTLILQLSKKSKEIMEESKSTKFMDRYESYKEKWEKKRKEDQWKDPNTHIPVLAPKSQKDKK